MQGMEKSIEKYSSSYNYYDKLEEAVEKNDLYDYMSSTPHYRCTPEKGMTSMNDFDCVVKNINYFLYCRPDCREKFYETIKNILNIGNFYEIYSVCHIIRIQYGMQFHKKTDIFLIDDDIFELVRIAIQKHSHRFSYFNNTTIIENEIVYFYETWDNFLRKNTTQYILSTK